MPEIDARRSALAAALALLAGCPAPMPRPADDMVEVQAGPFLQGIEERDLEGIVELCRAHAADGECDAESIIEHHRGETPQRRVELPAFAIDRTEVTNAAYLACVAAGGCTPVDADACVRVGEGEPAKPRHEVEARGLEAMPVVCASPSQAAAYCGWAGKRLPSEQEWERAARGSDGRRFPWGDAWDDHAANWSEDGKIDGWVGTSPVASYPRGASPYGALDMAGNVWEWVADEDAEGRPVMRGGGYAALPIAMRTTKRVPRPNKGHENIGFRCVR